MDHPNQEEPVQENPPPEPAPPVNEHACGLCQIAFTDAPITNLHCGHRVHTACAFVGVLHLDRHNRLWRFRCRICQTPCMTDAMFQNLFEHENDDASTVSSVISTLSTPVKNLEKKLAEDPTFPEKLANLKKKRLEYNKANAAYTKKAKEVYKKFKQQTSGLVDILKQTIKEHKKETVNLPEAKALRSAKMQQEATFSRLVRKYDTTYTTLRHVLNRKYRYRHAARSWWRRNAYLYKYYIRIH